MREAIEAGPARRLVRQRRPDRVLELGGDVEQRRRVTLGAAEHDRALDRGDDQRREPVGAIGGQTTRTQAVENASRQRAKARGRGVEQLRASSWLSTATAAIGQPAR